MILSFKSAYEVSNPEMSKNQVTGFTGSGEWTDLDIIA